MAPIKKSIGPTKILVWACEGCIYLDYDEYGGEENCTKSGKYLYNTMPLIPFVCPYLKNESTNP